jgi:hypothetical protein
MLSPSDYSTLNVEGLSFEQSILPENPPQKYFQFAMDDINSAPDLTERVMINALSNLKRALHLQVEIIADAFGYQQYTKMKTSHFPQKLEFCKKCGIIGPGILLKVNKIRNLVEHSYYIPKQAEVSDYADIVELFIEATNRFILQFPFDTEISVSVDSNKDLPEIYCVMIPPNEGIIYIPYRSPSNNKKSTYDDLFKKNAITINAKEKNYFEWVKLIIDNMM